MKIVKITTLFTLLCIGLPGLAQGLSIEECYQRARANYPTVRQFDLIEKAEQYNLSNANSGYLPQVTLSAKASYQSEVTEIPISMPGVVPMKRDQYNATIDVNQAIWDGGAIKARKQAIATLSDVDTKSLEVELYSLRDRINQIYFAILLFDAQLEQNRLYTEELQRNFDKINASFINGVANRSDLDAVRVEQLKATQNRSQLTHSKTAYVAMLSVLIGQKLSPDTQLITPTQESSQDTINHRPELDLYAAQKLNLEAQNMQITAEQMPRFNAFVSGGYGRPGLNMLKSEFWPYYTAGVRVSWNISSFYNTKNSRRLVKNSIEGVEVSKKSFLFNSEIDISTRSSEIAKYRDQLQYDDQIISLRTSVKTASQSKMANGTISGIDLMRDVTAEDLAKQDKIYHQIELLQAIYNLKYVTNNF